MKISTISRYVTRNPEILSGEPIIDGTRTPVRAIVAIILAFAVLIRVICDRPSSNKK